MAKRSTPKKQQCKSSSSSRYKTYQRKAQIRLENIAKAFNHSRKNWSENQKKEEAEKLSKKITKIKA